MINAPKYPKNIYSTHFGVANLLVATTTGSASTSLSNHPWLFKFNSFRVF